ncbi:hypothetical protein [Klebsiella phage 05F01]|nr:hypothetical protein [Klebsiella phage 05F01]
MKFSLYYLNDHRDYLLDTLAKLDNAKYFASKNEIYITNYEHEKVKRLRDKIVSEIQEVNDSISAIELISSWLEEKSC